MIIFKETTSPQHWFCQGHFDCLLASLMNSGMIDTLHFTGLERNFDFKNASREEKIKYELKLMALWAAITGYYPLKHRESFHTIYSSFFYFVTKEKSKLSTEDYNKKINRYIKKLHDLENYFAEHDGKSINNGSWDGGAHLRVHVEKFTDLDDLPYKSLLCIEKKHWVVYLGMKGEDAVVLDPNICDGFMKLPIDELKECAIIKPKSVKTDDKAIHNIMMDFELNEKKTLEDLRRREFSKKFARLIERLEEINFSEKDYNTYIKRSQNFLDKLKKDHHRYEYRASETID